ncbi:DUF2180 family protein [Streptomyces sp. NPDC055709]
MHCFDCTRLSRESLAAAVCSQCGAGLCTEHTVVVETSVRRVAGMGRVTSPFPARRMTCAICNHAHRAA